MLHAFLLYTRNHIKKKQKKTKKKRRRRQGSGGGGGVDSELLGREISFPKNLKICHGGTWDTTGPYYFFLKRRRGCL